VINVDNQGAAKGKNKAQGGKRVMYTSHHPCWDAKNRHNLSEELLFDYKQIAHCIPVLKTITPPTPKPATTPTSPEQLKSEQPATTAPQQPIHQPAVLPTADDMSKVPKALADLMKMNGVTIKQIQKAVAHKGYYPEDTPIENYDSNFIQGVLVAAWTQVYGLIQSLQGEEKPY
jgi:hypothetical protein